MRAGVAAVCMAAAAVFGMGACSSDSDPAADTTPTTAAPIPAGEAPVLIERIRPAVAALEEQLGGAQHYFEVNADAVSVHLFVATETGVTLYTYAPDGSLTSEDLGVANGPTFSAAEMTFDETKALAQTAAQLPTSSILKFAVAGVDGGGVKYSIEVQSEMGSTFTVTVGPTGTVVGTDQLMPDVATTEP